MTMTLKCRGNGEATCAVSCQSVRLGMAECDPARQPVRVPGQEFGVRERPVPVPVEHTCQIGQPACGLPSTFTIAVAGLSNRAEGAPLPIGGFLHLCEYHSGLPAETWS